MRINGRRAVCSVLRVVHVHVRDGVLIVHRIVLKRDVVMRRGHLFVNLRCRVYSLCRRACEGLVLGRAVLGKGGPKPLPPFKPPSFHFHQKKMLA